MVSATRDRRVAAAQREARRILSATQKFLRDTVKALRAAEKSLSGAGPPGEVWTGRTTRVGILFYQIGICRNEGGKPCRLFVRRWLNGHKGVVASHALLGAHWKAHRDVAEILAAAALLPDLVRRVGRTAKGVKQA